MVYRVYVEKKPEFANEAQSLTSELKMLFNMQGLEKLRIINRYDVENITKELFDKSVIEVFSEAPVDDVFVTLPQHQGAIFAVESLPGQFNQRADSAGECIQLISQAHRPIVQSAKVYLLFGKLHDDELNMVKKYLINPVEARQASLEEKETLVMAFEPPEAVQVLDGFIEISKHDLENFAAEHNLAMDVADLAFCQKYFASEKRNPTITELRVIDTYWSDHCRHTTFNTVIENILVEDEAVENSFQLYEELRREVFGEKTKRPKTLMDLATIGAKVLKKRGVLTNLDESEEINACSVKIKVDNDGQKEDWLLLFKNETHNHPTEIEPFGGAATCIGGAIRDPLANRGYVYAAMRVTGAANPLLPLNQTAVGKLPQRKIVQTAARGYSSYGNQIGLATGQVTEIYHPKYVAKRMEIGAVLGAVPLSNVKREVPQQGDVVLLLGGSTGRDGCGGAVGSSMAHGEESLETCGAQVQKGNAPTERKLQRLFKQKEAVKIIRRCNDFGAGGVCVAVGELADGLCINLDAVPKKYEGLSATETAISESQERMAVVVAKEDVDKMLEFAAKENLQAAAIAVVTKAKRLEMSWKGQTVVNLSREFLNSNGASKKANVKVCKLPNARPAAPSDENLQTFFEEHMQNLNNCSQKGLSEMFDSTIGAATVLMPHGGKNMLTPPQAMVMKLPVLGETTTCSGMAFGFNPYVSDENPHTGAYLAVLESVAKLVGAGFSKKNITLSFQEYFERLKDEPLRWGKPFSSLLGALHAQIDFGTAAIGGKDSMSGSFENLDVPPTLVSFAVAAGETANIISPEFKKANNDIFLIMPKYKNELSVPQAKSFNSVLETLEKLIKTKKVVSAWAIEAGGLAKAVFNMCIGNGVGANLFNASKEVLFSASYGSFLVETSEDLKDEFAQQTEFDFINLGETTEKFELVIGQEKVNLQKVQKGFSEKLEPVFPSLQPTFSEKVQKVCYENKKQKTSSYIIGKTQPKVLIPVFSGTNCELDTARAMRMAGASAEVFVVCNQTPSETAQSVKTLCEKLKQSQMLVLPGGFSGGDEPEGSAKLIAAFFRGEQVANEVHELIYKRDGLVLGICNGFQALVKLGLLPSGKISKLCETSPTLTTNKIGRHQSGLVRTCVASNKSPWLASYSLGQTHTVAISHGEGRFIANEKEIEKLLQNGQIATQYVNFNDEPSMEIKHNPNASVLAIEGITSPDGRIFGKMGHSERFGNGLYKNVPNAEMQNIFKNGVSYFG